MAKPYHSIPHMTIIPNRKPQNELFSDARAEAKARLVLKVHKSTQNKISLVLDKQVSTGRKSVHYSCISRNHKRQTHSDRNVDTVKKNEKWTHKQWIRRNTISVFITRSEKQTFPKTQ